MQNNVTIIARFALALALLLVVIALAILCKSAASPHIVITLLASSLPLAVYGTLTLFRRERHLTKLHAIAQHEQANRETAKLAAVESSMRILAHDVRKPFSLMSMGLHMLRNAKTAPEQVKIAERLSQEVEQALQAVHELIQKMMQGPIASSTPETSLKSVSEPPADRAATHAILAAHKQTGKRLNVLVIDDEPLYSEAIQDLIAEDQRLMHSVSFQSVTNPDEALAMGHTSRAFDVIICDIDLGCAHVDGYGVVKTLRQQGLDTAKICIHSNRAMECDRALALETGADEFLPKPMSRSHLLRLLASATKSNSEETLSARPCFAVVDDDIFVLDAWQMTFTEQADVLAFTSPTDFWQALDQDPKLAQRLSFVVTDYYFDHPRHGNGEIFAKHIRQRLGALQVLLSSDGVFHPEETQVFAAVISKTPQSYMKLQALLR